MTGFNAVSIDDRFKFGAHRFTAEEIKRFAGLYDPQPFHTDEEAARNTLFGALCASGWHTSAVMMRLMVDYFRRAAVDAQARGEPAPPALGPSPGFDNLRWMRPVFVGDEISFTGRITDKRLSQSRPGWGIVSMDVVGTNQKGEAVFSYTGHVFMRSE